MDFEAADATPTTVPEEEEQEDETSFTETFLSIEEEKRRIMTRGQKKHFEQNVQEVEASDECLWSTLRAQGSLSALAERLQCVPHGDICWGGYVDLYGFEHGL